MEAWATEAGQAARHAQVRLLARADGQVGEFAREVLAGRAHYRDVLYSSILDDRHVGAALAVVDTWAALPEAEREAIVAGSEAETERLIAELTEPRPVDPPDDPPASILSDAW